MRLRQITKGLLSVFLAWASPCVLAAPTTQPTRFMRFVEEKSGAARLEVASVTYVNADDVSVTLIGAVHIGDEAYYRGLDESFEHYDALLYELVSANEGARPAKGQKSDHWIGKIQQAMQSKLGLHYQLDEINYHRPNFVHADMNWDSFSKMQDERNESLFMLSLKSALRGDADKMDPGVNLFTLLGALNSPDSEFQLKYLLGRMFANADETLETLGDDTVIITERNKAAMKVLRREIDAGKSNIGVFYGAGHLKGMEDTLETDMGFKKVGTVWRTAWDISGPAEPNPATLPATLPSTQSR